MIGLKTLKDMDFEADELPEGNKVIVATSHQLKQEAIKDIKALKEAPLEEIYKDYNTFDCHRIIITYIMWKFNIKEEDLK